MNEACLRWLSSILEERYEKSINLTFDNNSLYLRLNGGEGQIIFDRPEQAFFRNSSNIPCSFWDARAEGWHSVLGRPLPAPAVHQIYAPLIERCDAGYVIHYDILGLTYWMLSRLEEAGRTDLDEHGRFPATSSHAFKHGYLERPIIDEWLHVLGQVIQRQWPGVKLKKHLFSFKVSHDVDNPSRSAFVSPKRLIRLIGGDFIRRRDIMGAFNAALVWFQKNRNSLHPADPMNTFEWLMDVSEDHNLQSAFYFICGRTDPSKDADYEVEHPAIRSLMRSIHDRGHEIGLHPSYGTYQNQEAIVAEANRFRRVCSEEGITQDEWGGRMHFLRWEHPTTMLGWEKAGMTYDATLGYADCPGFRCGTCYEYPAFDPVSCKVLDLRIRPLVAMECTVMADRYTGLGTSVAAFKKFNELKSACKAVQGCFTLLWHNSLVTTLVERELYQNVLGA